MIEGTPLSDPATRQTVNLLGIDFDVIGLDETVARVRRAAALRQSLFLSTANVNFAVLASQDAAFRRSLDTSDLCVPDGAPIVWLARLMGLPLRQRVAGADIFEALRYGAGDRLRIFFFGGPPGIASRAAEVINSEGRGMVCVGFESPGYGDVDSMSSPETIERINAARADFVVVSLGAQKGQAWIVRNRERLSAPVVSHLGAVVNFVAGEVLRAPQWMQRGGMEWAWRIWQEPALARRYAKDGLVLLTLVVREVWLRVRRRAKAPGDVLDDRPRLRR